MQVSKECPHYQRNCHVEAPCCKIFYPCKLCHDEHFTFKKGCQVERMMFDLVEKVKCLDCGQISQPTTHCKKCNIQFGKYSCLKCKLYQNNPSKVDDIFHCDNCKMCRRGKRDAFQHCFTCGYCVAITKKGHKCIEDVKQSKCPICLEVLFYSTKKYIDLKCGHLIHLECLDGYNNINCPSCGMAMQKISKKQNANIQKLIDQTKEQLPPELKDKKVDILCNECLHKTMQAPFHFYGIKCESCGTYNTKMI